MVNFTNVTVIAALIAAIGTILVAIFNFLSTQRSQRKQERLKADLAEEQERLKADLTEKQKEKEARRDYEYEARKRLYQQDEPLFFQLVECSEKALWRIYSLARTAHRGDLGPDHVSWLSKDSFYYPYYTASTIYKLLSPLVYFKLIQQHLTLVDLEVDPYIKEQYTLAKWLYMSFTEGFKLASKGIEIDYDPDCDGWEEKRIRQPQKYWRQALFEGRLDCVVEALIVPTNSGVGRCMSYGEFESAFWDEKAQKEKKFDVFTDLFLEFHPRTRPILWRLLITQTHLHAALQDAPALHVSTSNDHPQLLIRPIKDREPYDWRHNKEEASDEEVLAEPFNAAQAYLQEVLASNCAF